MKTFSSADQPSTIVIDSSTYGKRAQCGDSSDRPTANLGLSDGSLAPLTLSRSPRSARRKSSGKEKSGLPSWLWPVVFVTTLLAVGISLMVIDWGDDDSPSASADQKTLSATMSRAIQLRSELAELLVSVKDQASAKSAESKLEKLADRLESLNQDFRSVLFPTTPTGEELVAAFTNPDFARVTGQLTVEMLRVGPATQTGELAPLPFNRVRSALRSFEQLHEEALLNAKFTAKPTTPADPVQNPAVGQAATPPSPLPDAGTAKAPGTSTGPYRLTHIPGDTEYNVLIDQLHNFRTDVRDEQYVIVRLKSPHPDQFDGLASRLLEIVGVGVTSIGSPTLRGVGPVKSIEEFAACVDFGTVKKTDPATRMVEIEVDPSWVYTSKAGPTLQNPRNGR